ncbi:hypothetical protein J7E78_01600 [Paenibacillus polymyxa]|uniref:hypothetical protein n=1 Tax=Paenibacillus polymyxa TaxID=1406 RepID=UPI001BE951F1|nr:hypothetical protein [Paenibacillus polymyxa]MBT2282247.1 hypothetical protein [Paenibacillus polymyxa]
MSLKIKLPFMISVLVVLVLLGATTTSYMISSDVVVRKSKDEMNVMADRLGEGLWTAMQLQQQLSHAISVHNTFKELLKLRDTNEMTDETFCTDSQMVIVTLIGVALAIMVEQSRVPASPRKSPAISSRIWPNRLHDSRWSKG